MNRILRFVTVGAVTIGSLVATSSYASAHVVAQKGRMYQSDPLCVDGRAETSHGSGGGYSRSDSWARQRTWVPRVGWIQCGIKKSRPKGYIANRIWLYKWVGNEYRLCRYSNFVYNNKTVSHWWIYSSYGAAPDCGTGWYETFGESYVKFNGTWHGDNIASGWHYLGGSTTAAAPNAGAVPTSVTAVDANGSLLKDSSGNPVKIGTTARPGFTPSQPEPADDGYEADVVDSEEVVLARPAA